MRHMCVRVMDIKGNKFRFNPQSGLVQAWTCMSGWKGWGGREKRMGREWEAQWRRKTLDRLGGQQCRKRAGGMGRGKGHWGVGGKVDTVW